MHPGELAGTLLVTLSLDGAGTVQDVSTEENSTGSDGLAECFEGLLRGAQLGTGTWSAGRFQVRLHLPPAHADAEAPGDAGEPAPPPPPSAEERFAEWTGRTENKAVVGLLRALGQSRTRRDVLAQAHEQERTANDEAERPDDVLRVPLFPEATGAYLFTADDGPFVLRLSPGDSFRAYPGNRIQLTMYTRGERMQMTTGQALPVFLSGASPAVPRTLKGVHPNRAKEKSLLHKLKQERTTALAKLRTSVGKAGADGSFPLKASRFVRLEWDEDADARMVIDDADGSALFCVELGLSCEGADGETISREALSDP